jgi:hypothetical protein
MLDRWLEPDEYEEHEGERDYEEREPELFDFDEYIDQVINEFESKIRSFYDFRYPQEIAEGSLRI